MKKFIAALTVLSLVFVMTSCGNSDQAQTKESDDGDMVTLTGLADTTPHKEILDFVKDDLAAEGIKLDIVSETWDSTWNEQLQNGSVDFHYDAYQPYLDEWNKANNGDLIGAGAIHIEPIVLMSDKYKSVDEIPDGGNIAIKEDVTNQYRALKLLEQAGLIELKDEITLSNADVSMIKSNKKNLKIVALDADVIMNTRQDFDAYITNTNRILEAGLDPMQFLAREDVEGSIFGNVIAVTKENQDNENIKKLVKVLQTKKVADFIQEKYKGAILPAFEVK